MDARIFVGTAGGLWTLEGETSRPVEALAGRSVTALALGPASVWAVVDGSALLELRDGAWTTRASIDGPPTTCVAPTRDGVLVGTEQARLFRLIGTGLASIPSFETVEGRDAWYTPWGDPADVRSIAVALDGAIHVNVHVGGVARSRDGRTSWAPTGGIESDVPQVLAPPTRPGGVLLAGAAGVGVRRGGGESWAVAPAGPPA